MSDKLNHKVGICYIDLFHGIDCVFWFLFSLYGFNSLALSYWSKQIEIYAVFLLFVVFFRVSIELWWPQSVFRGLNNHGNVRQFWGSIFFSAFSKTKRSKREIQRERAQEMG